MAILSGFGWEKGLGTLGVNQNVEEIISMAKIEVMGEIIRVKNWWLPKCITCDSLQTLIFYIEFHINPKNSPK